jgi:hypothetical protein
MKLTHPLTAIGIATLATAAIAWQVAGRAQPNPIPKHLPGAWTVEAQITKHLDPDSRLARFANLSFTNDPRIIQRYAYSSHRLRNMNVVLGGMMTIDGNSNPYVVAEKDGCNTLVWFHPGTESKLGDPVARCVSIVLGRDVRSDLLFLGEEDGARRASVCYKHASTAAK